MKTERKEMTDFEFTVTVKNTECCDRCPDGTCDMVDKPCSLENCPEENKEVK